MPKPAPKKTVRERLKENLETICFAIVIIGAVVSALMFLATKAEVEAVQKNLTINQVNDQIRETNSAIIQTDKQLMWMEKKLAAEGKKCELNERWRELRAELDTLKLQRGNLYDQLKAMKTKK
ncbi:MAG: hypothetical protein ACYSW3_00335 [Planctomycetota bacterium]|jgi:uncharacterized coiled-coil DUF342 family protein